MKAIPLQLSTEGTNYTIQLSEGIFTVESTERSYIFKQRHSLYLFIKGLMNDKMTKLGYDDCYIENTKYPILEVLNDYIDLIGEIFVK